MASIKEIQKLLSGIPKGSSVALSRDYRRVVSYGPDLKTVLRKAADAGENNPVIVGVPKTGVFFDGDLHLQIFGLPH